MINPNMLKQAQQLQARLAKAQEELAQETVEASVGGGAVRVVITGQQAVKSIVIDPAVVDPQDVEMLQDLMLSAFNEALDKARALAAAKLGAVTGGLKLPGLF